MKPQTNNSKGTKQQTQGNQAQPTVSSLSKLSKKQPSSLSKSPPKALKPPKYKTDFIKKDNYDTMTAKINITEIKELPIKYVLQCIEGIFKNRFLYITTHKDGQVFGGGDAKSNGLTLQIDGAGLSARHAQLKFDGFKSFDVMDFGSEGGTWLNIPKQGVQIKQGDQFTIGPHVVLFSLSIPVSQIQQLCILYHTNALADTLEYNNITTLPQLYAAEYNGFKDFPFSEPDKQKLIRMCSQSRKWFTQGKVYRRVNARYEKEPLMGLEVEIGWEPYYFCNDPKFVFNPKQPICEVRRGFLIPNEKVFSRIPANKPFPLTLHSQLKLGSLMFELNRFNTGVGIQKGSRPTMEDGLLIEEDIGGSEWKLISLFAVFDGHGGSQCMEYIRDNLASKVRGWTQLLDDAGDLNEMLRVLFNRTFYELDMQFRQKYPQISMTCGCTALVLLLIESKAYVFSLGDCKGYLFRNEILYQLNLDHLPNRGDERIRIQNAGGFVQYERLMGKCTLSRCFGQFQFKNIDDYKNGMKGKLKSYLSCIPDVVSFDLSATKDDFLLLSTDGLLSSLSIMEVTDYISDKYGKLELQESPNKIISSLIENCKIVQPDCDNIAVILLIIRRGLVGAAKAW